MKYVTRIDGVESWPIKELVQAKVPASGETMTALWSVWAPGSELAVHVHPNEQIGMCLQGRCIFTIDGEEYLVQKGDVYHIPPNIPHGERNEGDEDVIFFECFSPVREDLLRKQFGATIVGSQKQGARSG